VGVEKVDFQAKQAKSGSRKCLDDSRKSFIEHPDVV
jgi:hypothetical protein